jgi:hypothetical protein
MPRPSRTVLRKIPVKKDVLPGRKRMKIIFIAAIFACLLGINFK